MQHIELPYTGIGHHYNTVNYVTLHRIEMNFSKINEDIKIIKLKNQDNPMKISK